MVPLAGVEPARYHYHWILSPARLPISPQRQQRKRLYNNRRKKASVFAYILAKKNDSCYNIVMEKLVLIDGNSLLNRAFYAMAVFTTKDGLPTNGVFGFVKLLLKIIDDENPEYLAVAFDVHAPTFRHKKYAEYKGTRKPTPEDLVKQMPMLKELLRSMGICTIELAGYEADDIIGTLSRKYDGVETVIFTGDRDAFQLVNDSVSVCFTKRGVSDVDRLTGENFYEKQGYNPLQVIELKSLMGDSSDNIPGVKGVGEKTALQLVQKYGSLENILNHVDELKQSLRDKFQANEETARLSHELATIDLSVPLTLTLDDCRVKLPFPEEARAQFARLEFRSLVDSKYFPADRSLTVDTVICKTFEEFLSVFRTQEEFAFDLATDCHFYCGGKEFIFRLRENLFGEGFFLTELAPLLKEVFSSKKRAILADLKALSHRFDEMGIPISCPVEDVTLLCYLCDSNVRSIDAAELAKGYAIPEENRAYALKRAYDETKNNASEAEMQIYRNVELPLIGVLADMERVGVRVDSDRFPEFRQRYNEGMSSLSKQIFALAGLDFFNLNSPFQLSEILFEKLGCPTHGAKKNIRGGYSTNAEILEKLAEDYEIARLILRYREVQKLQSTYIDGMSPLIQGGLIHTTYNQTTTTTGRLSSVNPNLQNIPVRTEEGRELRKLFIAREGNVLIDADYSQIELRLLAHCSGCRPLIEAYNEGRDIHATTASQVFNVPLGEVTAEMRRSAKVVNFGIIYGMSAHGLSKDLNISISEASRYIERYFERYSQVKEYMDKNVEFARENGYVTTIFGRKRFIPELRSTKYNVRSFGERAAMNMPLQGSAADIIKIAMVNVFQRIQKEGLRARMIMQVHDELLLDCPIEEVEQASKLLKEEMESAANLRVPLVAEVATGANWYESKK